MLPAMAADYIGFIETFNEMRLVPKDPDDRTESEKVPLLSYGTLNPERAQDRKKMLEHDQRMAKELRKEFGRASDHSTLYDALMKLWKTVEPSVSGPATDFASWNIKMGVVGKNATGRLLKDLSAEESQQPYDWIMSESGPSSLVVVLKSSCSPFPLSLCLLRRARAAQGLFWYSVAWGRRLMSGIHWHQLPDSELGIWQYVQGNHKLEAGVGTAVGT